MKALYLTYDGLLEPLGNSQVVPVVEGLAQRGIGMELVSFEKPEDMTRAEVMSAMRERLDASGVTWIPLPYHRRPTLPATAYDIWRGIREVRRAAKAAGGRILVHARSYVPALMGLRGLADSDSRLLFDMRGFWVDERVEAGRWEEGSLVVTLARRAEKELLARADHLVHLTRAGMDVVTRLSAGGKVPPGTVIPTGVDLDAFRPRGSATTSKAALGLGPGPVIIHIGTLSGWYLGEETFRLAKALVARTGGEFVVLTREKDVAVALAGQVGIHPRILTVPHGEIPGWLEAADVGLALVRPGFSKRASAPTKVGEYLASGLVVVGTRGVGDLEEQFEGSPVAFTIGEQEDRERLVERIVEALGRQDRREQARALANQHYNLEDGIRSYARIYRRLGVTE